MLSAFLGITDNNWFDYLRRNQITDEVNFWVPSAPQHRHVEPGSLWLLKLHSPLNFIAGAGVFMHYSVLPLQMAWDAFGIGSCVGPANTSRTTHVERRELCDARGNRTMGRQHWGKS